jgi:crotonobetainyl-CoA:carnitine CoA-transferase CaiB-like acyl-CoA transferase
MEYCNDLLKGIKVVELASILAGPSVGMFFAELGAEVIKVENPRTGGDATRQWKTKFEDADSPISAYYASINWGKKVEFLDLKSQEGKERVFKLLETADILIYNYKAGDEIKLGMDYETLKLRFPRLLIGHISGYDLNDHRPAFDLVLQAETGFISINGSPKTGPVKMPLPLIDILAAHQLKEALLAGLIQRFKTGAGAYFHVSLFDAGVASLVNMSNNVLMGNMDPGLTGSLHPNIAPYGETLRSSDSTSFVLAVGNDEQFHGLCKTLDIPDEIFKRYNSNVIRVRERESLDAILNEYASRISGKDLSEGMTENGVPFGKIKSVKEVVRALPEHYFLKEKTEGRETIRIRSAMFQNKK